MHLSKERIEAFAGDVLPIKLCFDENEPTEHVTWSADSDAVAEGKLHAFSGVEVVSFSEIAARFLKFEALSTVGYESDVPRYMNAPVSIGELSVFEA